MPFFGNGKSFGKQLQTYDAEILAVTDFISKHAQPGDVVLCGDEMVAPIVSLTNSRIPFGLFAQAAIGRSDYTHRESQVKEFWKHWQLGDFQYELLREAGVRYILVRKASEGVPATVPDIISKVFENSEFALFEVKQHRLNETMQSGG